MSVTKLRPAGWRDIAWNWARAEIDSPRFAPHDAHVGETLLARVRAGDQQGLDDAAWSALTGAVARYRGGLLRGLRRLGTEWFSGELDLAEIPDLRVMNYLPFVAICPTRRLGDLAAALAAGREPPGAQEFATNFAALRHGFATARLAEARPILVTERAEGPYTLLEGYSRLAAVAARCLAGTAGPGEIPVLLGKCPRIAEWRMADDPAKGPLF
jgi:hypothetical protein